MLLTIIYNIFHSWLPKNTIVYLCQSVQFLNNWFRYTTFPQIVYDTILPSPNWNVFRKKNMNRLMRHKKKIHNFAPYKSCKTNALKNKYIFFSVIIDCKNVESKRLQRSSVRSFVTYKITLKNKCTLFIYLFFKMLSSQYAKYNFNCPGR